MDNEVFATALGRILGARNGLMHLVVPSEVSDAFIAAVVAAANQSKGQEFAFHVNASSTGLTEEITPERATELRSRESGAPADALIIAREGQFKELKSLEAFVIINPAVLFSGLAGVQMGSLTGIEVFEAIVDAALISLPDSSDAKKLDRSVQIECLNYVAKYLADAYKEYGNQDIGWKTAWWLHLRNLANRFANLIAVHNLGVDAGRYMFLAAGIPQPEQGQSNYGTPNGPRAFARRVRERWQTGEEAYLSCLEIERQAKGDGRLQTDERHPILELSWLDGFDTTVAELGHPMLAMSLHQASDEQSFEAWAQVDERYYFEDLNPELRGSLWKEIDHDTWQELPVLSIVDGDQWILVSKSHEISEGRLNFGKIQLKVDIPYEGYSTSSVELESRPKQLKCDLVRVFESDLGTCFEFDVSLVLPKKGSVKWRERPYSVNLRPRILAGETNPFGRDIDFQILVPLPNDVTYFVSLRKKNARKRKLVSLAERRIAVDFESGALESLDDDDRELSIDASDSLADIVIVGREDVLSVGDSTIELEEVPNKFQTIRSASAIKLFDGQTIRSGFNTGLLVSLDEKDERPLSPIFAAARDTLPTDSEDSTLVRELRNDVRGLCEADWLARYCEGDGIERGLPIAIAFQDNSDDVRADSFSIYGQGVQVLGSEIQLSTSPPQFDESRFDGFWRSFRALNLPRSCAGLDAHTSKWPSRIDLGLVTKDQVENYLGAYFSLLDSFRGSDDGKWVCYPFSVLVFDEKLGGYSGVLLSPLHPLRFAWHWSVQYTCREIAQNPSNSGLDPEVLLKFLDGANLPFFGPCPDGFDDFVALRLDAGVDELFASWSYLQNASPSSRQPINVSGVKFPAAPSSGLDRGGVAAAINDYLRVYPFVSELTINLHSQRKTQRSTELDRAVVGELVTLLNGRSGRLPGGIRVFDSKERLGPIPSKRQILSKVSTAVEKVNSSREDGDLRFPFEWATRDMANADIRFLEESLVRTTYRNSPELEATGAIPNLPITRLHVWSNISQERSFKSGFNPLLGESGDDDLPSFYDVLDVIERWNGGLEIWSQALTTSLQDNRVNWVVSGSSNLDPWLLSRILTTREKAQRVLWEWRPAHLPRRWRANGSSSISSRPYTVLASLTDDFRREVERSLEACLGRSSSELVDKMFEVLGAKGVGVTSLLSMGHQQSLGAVGFFLGFELGRAWEEDANEDEVRMVLPLDAVNPVFEALAPELITDERKKADLVLISAKIDRFGSYVIEFCPVEIKMHTPVETTHKFPSVESRGIKGALQQLENSRTVLGAAARVLSENNHSALVNSTIATLVEMGLAIGSTDTIDVTTKKSLLSAVASGQCKFCLGTSVLFWFERNGQGHGSDPFLFRRPLRSLNQEATIVFLDPSVLIDDSGFDTISRGQLLVQASKFISDPYNLGAKDVSSPSPQLSSSESNGSASSSSSAASFDVPELTDNEAWSGSRTLNDRKVADENGRTHDVDQGVDLDSRSKIGRDELDHRYEKMIETLASHNVTVFKPSTIEPYSEGPASVVYRFELSVGTEPQRAFGRTSVLKLALGLRADQDIRPEIDLGCVTFDVPKAESERYFVEAKSLWNVWKRPENELEAPIGIDQYNGIVVLNFSSPNSPHLLIGGTTGSGKSEALNTILTGMVRHYSENELRLLLVDPKGTELSGFEEFPHLLGEIGWDEHSALEQLDLAFNEMQLRYELFREVRARSLKEYNEISNRESLPWWVVVLDEYADLTSDPDVKKKIEGLLKRLAQKARAAGIHVIIATQKPSAEVINTVLRSNLPAQLALRVKSSTESRVIMDDVGAEMLNGKGDAFLKANGKLTRLQCAIVKNVQVTYSD